MKPEELRARYAAGERDFVMADLNEAHLSRANLNGANLSRTNLSRANLASADLIDADLSGACLNRAHLYGANLHRANLTGATLTSRVARSGQWAFEGTVWPTDPALLEGTTVDHFVGAVLPEANLRGTNLYRADLRRSNLVKAKMSEAVCKEVDFRDAVMRESQCYRTDFTWANLNGADLTGAYLAGATFTLLDWSGQPCSDENTKWPTEAKHYEGATLDGEPFLDTVAFYRELGAHPDPTFRADLASLVAARQSRNVVTAAVMNTPPAREASSR